MSWSRTPPTEPGRFWFRRKDSWNRAAYGLALIVWREEVPGFETGEPPYLLVRCTVTMAADTLPHEGWSYGGLGMRTMSVEQGLAEDETLEFWSEPLTGPPGLLPPLPPKPEPTPREALEANRRAQIAKVAAAKKKTKAAAAARQKQIRDAIKRGVKLFSCSNCDDLHEEDDLVTVRECPHCQDEKFNGTENGQTCPSCNRRFTRNAYETGCPDCLDECEPIDLNQEQAR